MSHMAFIQFTNVTGEADLENYNGWIGLQYLSYAIVNNSLNSPDSGSWGSGRGELAFFKMNINYDKSICALQKYAIEGTHIEKITIHLLRTIGDKKPSVWEKYILSEAYIYEFLGGQASDNTLGLSLKMREMEHSYTPVDYKGSAQAETHVKWDLVKYTVE